MTDSWTELLSRPALLLPHPDPYPFTKHLSKSQSHSTLRPKPKLASRHQPPSSRLLVTQLVRRATTTTTKPSILRGRAPKLDPLHFSVIELTVPACEEDMDGLARPRREVASSSSAAKKRGPASRTSEVGGNAGYNEHDDENDNNKVTENRTAFHNQGTRHTDVQDPLYLPGDKPQPPSAHQQPAEPSLVHDMTEEFTSLNSPISSSMQPPSNSNSGCSTTLHARATPSSTSALAFPTADLDMNAEANAKIAMMRVEQKGNELVSAKDSSSTHLTPPPSWSEAAFDTQLVPGESASPSTSTSTSISASSACRESPVPGMAAATAYIADKDTIAEAGMPMRLKSMHGKSKRWVGGSGKSQRREDDGGECKSDVADTYHDAHSAFASTSTPASPLLSKNQTYVYKHKRTASLGDAAVSLFLGVERRKEFGKAHGDQDSDDDESENFEFSEKWIKNAVQANPTQALQADQRTKRARFVILGSESDMDLPSNINSSWSSSTSPPRLTVRTEVSSGAQPQTQQPLRHPPSSFLVSTSSGAIQRPPLLRRDALSDSHKHLPRRRWSLANAMTDEAISDEGLVRELERMCELGIWKRELLLKEGENLNEGETILVDADSMWEIWEGMLDRKKEYIVDEDEDGVVNLSPSFSYHLGTASWLTAQRALLICRELIMTERHYHALLLSLLAGDTRTPPDSLMLHYAAELVHASAAVLRAMEQQPNASGVAKAFTDNVEEVEGAYVRWCGVVGGWFNGAGVEESGNSNAKLKRNRSRYRSSIDSAITDMSGCGGLESEDGQSPPPVSPLKRVRTWRRSLPSVASLGEATASIYGYGYGTTSRSLRRRNKDKDPDKEEQVGSDLSSPPSPSSPTSGQNLVSRPPRVRGKPTVRDLAILPTQRVMRYVLLYRDLLSRIPPNSSSRVFVEQAVDAACRIADKCDRAQGNAAFIVAGDSSAGAGGSNSPTASNEAQPTTRRSNSGRTTATTSSDESTPPTSVESERQPEEVEEDEEESKRDSNDGCNVKLSSSMRRVSMSVSFMSSIGWSRN